LGHDQSLHGCLCGFLTPPCACVCCVCMCVVLQFLRLAPAGSSAMHTNLVTGAVTLYESGVRGIFTPMYFFVARKPEGPVSAPATGRRGAK
jgi:hypothetical protein